MSRLVFLVQGSQSVPYTVTATGSGAEFQIHCSCPASRRAAKMCKHVAALLVGDVTKLVQPSDSVEDLGRLAVGSRFVDRAMSHNPTSEKSKLDVAVKSLQDLWEYVAPIVEEKNFEMHMEPYGDGSCIAIYTKFKNGRRRSRPSIVMAQQFEIWDEVMLPDGSVQRGSPRPRVRPWSVVANKKSAAWKDVEGAAAAFVTAIREAD
ncbi:MAG: SWIM zinc finger family protein [Pseudomonadota bacterium]